MSSRSNKKTSFTKHLLAWNREVNERQMPWKGEKDPYRIWLSEIILQQTRVEQGWAYYEKFITTFPDIYSLVAAPEQEVFKLWEGLGYYSRCRNLIAAANSIAKNHQGKFPADYKSILSLKGVGSYTAAAIASFAFGLPYAVVDGNVIRLLARYFGISKSPATSNGRATFNSLAAELLCKAEPAAYNQAIMDFGATICKPVAPICSGCVLWKECYAFNTGTIPAFPVKAKKPEKKKRWLNYLIFDDGDNVLLRLRKGKDIWQNLYEFFLEETENELPATMTLPPAAAGINAKILLLEERNQTLTHQQIRARFFHLSVADLPSKPGYVSFPKSKLPDLPFPGIIREFMAHNPL